MALTKDLIDNPSLWHLSLMAGSHALDVFARPVVGDAPAVGVRLPYDAAASSIAGAVEEAVYANPMLLQPFGRTDIVVDSDRAMVVPAHTSAEGVRTLLSLPASCVLRSDPIDSANELMYGLDERLDNFIARTFDTARVTHSLAVLARYYTLRGRRSNSSNMIVNLGQESADLLVFNRYGLVMARHFDSLSDDDAVYYILAVFRQAGLDPTSDELIVAGNAGRRMSMIPRLSRFVGLVLPAIFPAAAHHGDPAAMKAPFALALLPLSECQ